MQPYPQDKSVLILDNCAIHKNAALREVIESTGEFCLYTIYITLIHLLGSLLIFLPPYSPDLNPIEESFSAGDV